MDYAFHNTHFSLGHFFCQAAHYAKVYDEVNLHLADQELGGCSCSNLSCPAVQCINDIVLRLIDQNPIAWIFLLLLGRSVPLQNRFHLYRNNHPDFFHVCRSFFIQNL